MDDTNTLQPIQPSLALKRPAASRNAVGHWLAICIAVIVGIFWLAVLSRRWHNEIAGPPLLKADGKELKATLISPHLEAKIEPGKNVLWCSTFQLVWNEGCRYAGGDIHLKDEPPMVAALNKKLGDEKDVDADSCLVMSGLVEDGIVKKIRQELERKFQGQADPDLLKSIESQLPSNGWLAYAYLSGNCLSSTFKRLKEPLAFGSAKVASFGLRKVAARWTTSTRPNKSQFWTTRATTISSLPSSRRTRASGSSWRRSPPPRRSRRRSKRSDRASSNTWIRRRRLEAVGRCRSIACMDESVVVPILNFDLWQEYNELSGKQITTPGPLQGMPIVLGMQNIRFRLDEHGAILKSEAASGATSAVPRSRRSLASSFSTSRF